MNKENQREVVGGKLSAKEFLSQKDRLDSDRIEQNLVLAEALGFGGDKKYGIVYPEKVFKKGYRDLADKTETVGQLRDKLQESRYNPNLWRPEETIAYLRLLEGMNGVVDPETRKVAGKAADVAENVAQTKFAHNLKNMNPEVRVRGTSVKISKNNSLKVNFNPKALVAEGLAIATLASACQTATATSTEVPIVTTNPSATETSFPTVTVTATPEIKDVVETPQASTETTTFSPPTNPPVYIETGSGGPLPEANPLEAGFNRARYVLLAHEGVTINEKKYSTYETFVAQIDLQAKANNIDVVQSVSVDGTETMSLAIKTESDGSRMFLWLADRASSLLGARPDIPPSDDFVEGEVTIPKEFKDFQIKVLPGTDNNFYLYLVSKDGKAIAWFSPTKGYVDQRLMNKEVVDAWYYVDQNGNPQSDQKVVFTNGGAKVTTLEGEALMLYDFSENKFKSLEGSEIVWDLSNPEIFPTKSFEYLTSTEFAQWVLDQEAAGNFPEVPDTATPIKSIKLFNPYDLFLNEYGVISIYTIVDGYKYKDHLEKLPFILAGIWETEYRGEHAFLVLKKWLNSDGTSGFEGFIYKQLDTNPKLIPLELNFFGFNNPSRFPVGVYFSNKFGIEDAKDYKGCGGYYIITYDGKADSAFCDWYFNNPKLVYNQEFYNRWSSTGNLSNYYTESGQKVPFIPIAPITANWYDN